MKKERVRVQNVKSINAKTVDGVAQGISYVVTFDNRVEYVCRMAFSGYYVGGSCPKTYIQKQDDENAKCVVFESRDVNTCIDFLLAIENKKLSWVGCTEKNCIDKDILEILY